MTKKAFLTVSLLLTVLILTSVSCAKPVNIKWVYYDETFCSDRWEYSTNNETLKNNIQTYLNGKGVKVIELEIFADGAPDVCRSCDCKTGRRVKCKIKRSSLEEAKAEGFYQ